MMATRPLQIERGQQEALDLLAFSLADRKDEVENLQARLAEFGSLQAQLADALERYAAVRNRLMGGIELVCSQHGVDSSTIQWDATGGRLHLEVPI